MQDWQDLTGMTGNEEIIIEKVKVTKKNISIEGKFNLPPLAKLTMEDQIFVAAFVKSHGSIKEMERIFGISYPTVKSRLSQVGKLLDFVDVRPQEENMDILEQLDNGKISFKEALEKIKNK